MQTWISLIIFSVFFSGYFWLCSQAFQKYMTRIINRYKP